MKQMRSVTMHPHAIGIDQVRRIAADVVTAVDASSAKYDDVPPSNNWFLSILSVLAPILLVGLFAWFLLSSMQGGGNRVMQFGKAKAT